MNFLRKFFKALWTTLVKPMVMAPINVFTSATDGDHDIASMNRNGAINLLCLIILIAVSMYFGVTNRYVICGIAGYTFGISQHIANILTLIRGMDDNEFDEQMDMLQAA